MYYYCMKSEEFNKFKEGFHTNVTIPPFEVVDQPYTKGSLYVIPVFRSATTNEIVPIPLVEELFSAVPVTCETGNEPITYQVMNAVSKYITNNLDMKTEENLNAIKDSFFQPYGLLKTNDSIIALVNIIIKDEFISILTNQNEEALIPIKIKDLELYTNLSEIDKLVLPTLVITK